MEINYRLTRLHSFVVIAFKKFGIYIYIGKVSPLFGFYLIFFYNSDD